MEEAEFSELIDCRFTYGECRAAMALMERANLISPNAMFIVLDELCRPPRGAEVTEELLLNLMDKWAARMDHPLASSILAAARSQLRGSLYSIDQAMALMEEVAPFPGLYGALSIAYFSCDDGDERLDKKDYEIRAKWKKQSIW